MPDFSNPTNRTAEQVRNRATLHRPDPTLDHLLKLRDTDPAAFRDLRLSPSQVIGLGMYENSKAAAEAGRAHIVGEG